MGAVKVSTKAGMSVLYAFWPTENSSAAPEKTMFRPAGTNKNYFESNNNYGIVTKSSKYH